MGGAIEEGKDEGWGARQRRIHHVENGVERTCITSGLLQVCDWVRCILCHWVRLPANVARCPYAPPELLAPVERLLRLRVQV